MGTACGRKRLAKPVRRKNAERSGGGGSTGDQMMDDKDDSGEVKA